MYFAQLGICCILSSKGPRTARHASIDVRLQNARVICNTCDFEARLALLLSNLEKELLRLTPSCPVRVLSHSLPRPGYFTRGDRPGNVFDRFIHKFEYTKFKVYSQSGAYMH